METVLVTGGAGFVGSHVCDSLLKAGKKVVCVDNFNDYYDPAVKERNIADALTHSSFVLCRVDILDIDALRKVFEEHAIDKVAHLAARAGVRASFEDPTLYDDVNIVGTRNVLDLAVAFKVKNVVFSSSSSVYGENTKVPFHEDDTTDNIISHYAETKRKAEILCKEYHDGKGLKITCLRFFTVYGPRGRPDMAIHKFTTSILAGKAIQMFGDGSSKRDYTYVGDIVAGVVLALDADIAFEIINIGNASGVALKELISTLEDALGKKAVIEQVEVQKGDVPETFADISKAQKLLGYSPKTSLAEGIRNFVDWYKDAY